MEARPPALRAKGCLGPPTVILAGNGPVQLSATHTSAPSVPSTAWNLNVGIVPTCVGPPGGGRSNTPPQVRSQGDQRRTTLRSKCVPGPSDYNGRQKARD